MIFIGDSIIQQLAQHEAWTQMFAPMHSLNLGIGGDRTENVLWRIQEGEMDDVKPKVNKRLDNFLNKIKHFFYFISIFFPRS